MRHGLYLLDKLVSQEFPAGKRVVTAKTAGQDYKVAQAVKAAPEGRVEPAALFFLISPSSRRLRMRLLPLSPTVSTAAMAAPEA